MKTIYAFFVILTLVLLNTEFIYPQWVQTNGPGGGTVFCIASINSNVFVGAYEGLFISSNQGNNWIHSYIGPTDNYIHCITADGTNIFAGTSGGVFLSTDNGNNWSSKGLLNYSVRCLAVSETNIFASTDTSGVFYSPKSGGDWTQVNNGLTTKGIRSLVVGKGNTFVGTDSGVFLSTNNGTLWTKVNNGLDNADVYCLAISDTNIYAGTFGGMYLSTDDGKNWTQINNGMGDYPRILSLTVSGNIIYAGGRGWGSSNSGVYRSTDNGTNWTQVSLNGYMIHSLAADGNKVFAGAEVFGGPMYIMGLFGSVDNGTTWTKVGLPISEVNALYVNGSNVYACAYSSVYLTSNNGQNWEDLQLSYYFNPSGTNVITTIGADIIVGCFRGLQHTTDNGLSWNSLPVFMHVFALTKSNNNIYAGGNDGVYLSTDSGSNWLQVNNGLINTNVNSIAINGGNIFAGTSPSYYGDTTGGVFHSSNNGANWTQVHNGLTNDTVNTLIVTGTNILAGTTSGVFISNENGTDWKQINEGLTNTNIHVFAVVGQTIFAGTDNGVFMSSDNNFNWMQVGLSSHNVLALSANDTYLFAGTDSTAVWRIALSDIALPVELTSFTASGGKGSVVLKWTTATELNNSGFDVERSGNKSDWEKVGFVRGNGNSTVPINYSFVDKSVSQVGKYYYRLKQVDNNGSFKYSSVAEVEFGAPSAYALNQNYPNPFNPSTKISYTLKDKGFVKLKVYGIKGELLKVLVNELKDAGYYESEFDGKGLASGVYIYRLEVIGDGNKMVYSDMKKTVLLK